MTRAISLAACTLAAGAVLAGPAAALEKVKFGTNWLPEAEHGGYYQAAADGTYEACGLDVEIVPGGPQVNNRALLLAGRIQFHMGGNLIQAYSAVEQDIPLKVVAAHFQKEPQVIMTHPDQGLDTWESLKDIDLLLSDEGFQSFFQWMVAADGFREEQRKPYTFNPAPFLADPRVGQQGYVTSEPFAIETKGGFKPNIFLIADQGFDTYATTVEVMQKTLDEMPEAVRCFVDGSAIGWYTYLYGDPSAGDAVIQEANPDMSTEQLAYTREKLREYGIVDSGDSLELGIGAMTDARFKSFYEKMVASGVLPEGIDVSAAYTLDYVNKGVGLDLRKTLTGE
ncbi:ABC transporter substrate-binding protein [Amorphus coralli]|uniref:ABC transporter substrate-binding protein n=1 Tax=Amorphus coralli TaxID=340680 RepID=UPI00036CD931|nr:ABC transporter substrate-binding protein [Amorphus coralli]